MSRDSNDVVSSGGEAGTPHVVAEASGKSWVVGIGDPEEQGKAGMRTLASVGTEGLVTKIGKACARAGGPSRVLLACAAGHEGFWQARWRGEHAPRIDVVMCDPASLELVRKRKRAKTDRIDARRMGRGTWARRVTVQGHGSPHAAAPQFQIGPASRNVAQPESGIVVTGPASAGQPNRTGAWARR